MAAVGAGAAVVAVKAVKTGVKVGTAIAKAAPKAERAFNAVKTVASKVKPVVNQAKSAAQKATSYFRGREFSFGKNVRVSLGNWSRGTAPHVKAPHYHRRIVDDAGQAVPGGGIGRHRPWEKKATDKSWWDRF